MDCATIKPGTSCVFMTKNGCNFNGGSCYTIVEACEGCARIIELPTGKYCSSTPDPSVKWGRGVCNLATHVKAGEAVDDTKKINPLKASKRAAAGAR